MKTINFIRDSIQKMNELQIPAEINIGSFKVESRGSLVNWAGRQGEYRSSVIYFRLQFRPDHIQFLFKLGVKIDLQNCKMAGLSPKSLRFKSGREAIKQGKYAPYYYQGNPENNQTGVIENWLETQATCEPYVLDKLDKICRDNHRDEVSIHNDTVLINAGFIQKIKYSRFISIESQYSNIKALRRNANGKKYLLPIHKRVLKMK
jgi:hypothetical protein